MADREDDIAPAALERRRLVFPVPGTVRWVDGQPAGVWGEDAPVTMHVADGDAIRPATRAERRMAAKLFPEIRGVAKAAKRGALRFMACARRQQAGSPGDN